MRKAGRHVVLAVLLAALAGCGVPDDLGPRVIEGELPFALASPAPQPSVDPAAASSRAVLYLVKGQHLERVSRPVVAGSSAQTSIDELLRGPTATDLARGLSSALPPDVSISVQVGGSIARADVGPELMQIRGQQQLLAIAQVVLTLSAVPGVDAVSFDLDGNSVDVPIGDGTLVGRPVTPRDYLSLQDVTR